MDPTQTSVAQTRHRAVLIKAFQGLSVLATLMALTAFADPAATDGEQPISFNRDIRPILSDRCFKCHGPDADNQESELRLDTQEHAHADLGGYFAIVPGDLDESELHSRIYSDDEYEQMPPPDELRGLSEAEKQILDRWIEQGAKYEGHWAFEPLPREVGVPAATIASGNGDSTPDWPQNHIDQFVLRSLESNGLTPNRAAPREKWLRRVTFDLTGLPPSHEEIQSFVQDDTADAYARVVDRLLDSDACAERLASEWLDVARYSDSYGYQRDDERYVWPWRDWVISAFRKNLPYDQFIQWQLAGDLLPNPSREQILATAFNRLHSHKKEGGVAIEEFRVENVADRAHTVASAFMGLTLECSRCHDHKYDPITTKDYYQLTSFFANVDERGLISYFTDAVPTPAMPLPSPEEESRLAEAERLVQVAIDETQIANEAANQAFEAWLAKWCDDTEVAVEQPGLIASLSFEELLPATKEESKDELGKDVPPKKGRMLALADAATEDRRAITTEANQLVAGKFGQGLLLTGDDSVSIPETGRFARHQPFSISIWMNAAEVTERAVVFRRSRGWDDAGSVGYELTKEGDKLSAKMVHFWPGNAICVETTTPLQADRWYQVAVTYDGSSSAAGLKIYVDGQLAPTTIVQDRLTRNITEWRNGYFDLAIGSRYRDRGFKGGKVDEFRVFDRCLAAIEVEQLFDGSALVELRRKPASELTADERTELRDYFTAAIHADSQAARDKLRLARAERNAAIDAIPAITIMREQETPRPAYVLTRGVYDQHGEEVTADTPGFLPPLPDDAPRNRLGLANWLTSPDHPLTARVAVNRYWQMIFGTGLVRTPEDFGNQSEPPTHPELLDWLARDFVDHGWDVRRLLQQMVLSATYRQSAVVAAAQRNRDPENRWLSRGPDQRLSAEMIRDNALAVSGLLVNKVGGPPVRPYDLALAYTPLPVDQGDKLYRRSLYTFWKRTSPSPVMMTMDASKREVCRLRREVTNSPLQALVLLNGPQFTEAARTLAAEVLQRHGDDLDAVIRESFERLTSRQPTSEEVAILTQLYNDQLTEYQADPQLAADLCGLAQEDAEDDASETAEADADATNTPAAASPTDATPDIDPARWAAATVLMNSLFNLDECVRHQ